MVDLQVVGIGSKFAEVGTVAWAERVRLELMGCVKDIPSHVDRIRRYLDIFQSHRAWTLLRDRNGSPFDTFEVFCSTPQPFGLGMSWQALRPYVEARVGKRAVDLATVAPAKVPDPPPPGPGRGKKKDRPPSGRSFSERPSHTADAQLRAIAERAPEPARELYKQGLLGQKEAAKLGPKNPKPEDAARVTAIAQELASEARALDASTEALRKQAQRALNLKARQLLGVQSDRVTDLLRAIERLADDDRARLVATMKERGWA
jgi:hypothetical protein